MDALGLAYAIRELRAWSKAGKTGVIRVKFTGGRIKLDNYQGPLACVAATAGVQLSIIEILR